MSTTTTTAAPTTLPPPPVPAAEQFCFEQGKVFSQYARGRNTLLGFLIFALIWVLMTTILNAAAQNSISMDTYIILDVISGLLILLSYLPMMYVWSLEDLLYG